MSQYSNQSVHEQQKRSRWITTLFVILIFFFGTLFALRGDTGSVTAQVDTALLGVVGTYGDTVFIPLESIGDFYLTESLDIGTQVDGEVTKNTCSGQFSNEEFGEYTLHIYTDEAPYIVVRYGEGNTLVFNQGRERLTNGIYEDLQEACGK